MSKSAPPLLPRSPTFQLDDAELAKLQLRQKYIAPLAASYRPTLTQTADVAAKLGISERTVRYLVKRYRERNGDLSALILKRAGRSVGERRLSADVETILAQAIERQYAQRQRITLTTLHRHVATACRQRGLKAPSLGTLTRRVKDFSPQALKRRREGADAARTLTPVVGEQMPANYPLHIIQMDHTKVDVIVVDSVHRQEIGRPYLTLAVDIYSRCVAGYVLTLEPPSALSVGLCMARIAEPKGPLLAKYGIEGEWPLRGKPAVLHTDNGSDFVSRALRQGCAAHGIELIHRPIGRPWYGGAIERIIGTFMKRVHELPGTTFSNVAERGKYPSQAKACMTLDELEHWLVYAIVAYHAEIHSRLGEPPLTRLQAGLKAFGIPPQVADSRVFLIDFLPVIRRRLSRAGFHLNNIVYYTPNLEHFPSR